MLIKQAPEDFIVEEIPIDFSGKGDYAIYCLTKKDYNTEGAIENICKRFGLQRKNIRYAGAKDRHALTSQYISIFKNPGRLSLDSKDLELAFASFHDQPLSLGSLRGNKFRIIVREIAAIPKSISQIPNYFDEQRFSEKNIDIGLCLLKKDFGKACELLELKADNNDYIKALRTIPMKILMMYVHSVQSYIFNEALAGQIIQYAKEKGIAHRTVPYSRGVFAFLDEYPQFNIQLVGFDPSGIDDVSQKKLLELGLSAQDFIIRQIPEISFEGAERKNIVDVKDLDIRIDKDTATLSFSLPKGSYATIVVKAMFYRKNSGS